MTTSHPDDDMSMEEILASIRKYVTTEDKRNTEEASVTSSSLHAGPLKAPVESIFELRDSQDKSSTVSLQPEFSPSFQQASSPTASSSNSTPVFKDEIFASSNSSLEEASPALAASSQAFARLKEAAKPREPKPITNTGVTVDQLITEMVRPMVKEWLERNLATMVENMVEQEIKRITNTLTE